MSLLKKYIVKPSLAFLVLVCYCEYLIYYVVLLQCDHPVINDTSVYSGDTVRVMLLSDPHLLGPIAGHWFDKLRREWQMYRTFQTAMTLFKPEVVFILGDIFDEGSIVNSIQFNRYVKRFYELFTVPETTQLYVVAGNHDVGFHYRMHFVLLERFFNSLHTRSVKVLSIKGNHFVLINTMAMELDGCSICTNAEHEITQIREALICAKAGRTCHKSLGITSYSAPILLQHFPMFRISDKKCSEPDEAPPKIKKEVFREKMDCLSQEATAMIFKTLNPRLIFSGHSHHGCHQIHPSGAHEWTISSFSWRNKNNPSFTLATFHATSHVLSKCYMPQESTVIDTYVCGVIIIVLSVCYKRIGQLFYLVFLKRFRNPEKSR